MARNQILEAIRTKRLVIEPLLRDFQIGPCSVDVRLGTQFQVGQSSVKTVDERHEIGSAVELPRLSQARFVTFETLGLAHDLMGLVVPRARFAILGLTATVTQITPGWRGKLVLGISNLSDFPVRLSVGQRVASILFFDFKEGAQPTPYQRQPREGIVEALDFLVDRGAIVPRLEKSKYRIHRTYRTGELEALNKVAEQLHRKISPANTAIQSEFCALLGERSVKKKGKLLEDLVATLLSGISGLTILRRNVLSRSGETDFIVKNHVDSFFWKQLGTPIIVECKNWKSPVDRNVIDVLSAKMEELGPDARTSILVSMAGVSGSPRRFAQLRIRDLRTKGRYVLVLNKQDLQRIADGEEPARIIEEKYDELMLI